MALIAADPKAAAESYIRVENSKIDPALLDRILANLEVTVTTTPQQTDRYASFMHGIGAIKSGPAGRRDYFFPEAHIVEGS